MARQKMITEKIKKDTPMYGSTAELSMEEQTVTAKFFDPTGSWTWYLLEMDEEQDLAYGFVTSEFEPSGEFGPFSINELKGLELPYGLYIERDKYFEPMNLKGLYDKVQNGVHI